MNPAQSELLSNLPDLRAAVAATATLRTILDDTWFVTVEERIHAARGTLNRLNLMA
jgi:hypothetical protein